jgi:hypothetical protein
MPSGNQNDPVIVELPWWFQAHALAKIYLHTKESDSSLRMVLIREASPRIKAKVSPGQYFMFKDVSNLVFLLVKDGDRFLITLASNVGYTNGQYGSDYGNWIELADDGGLIVPTFADRLEKFKEQLGINNLLHLTH